MATFKQKLGCWLHERWRTEFVLLFPDVAFRLGMRWLNLCNRHEHLLKENDEVSRICDWQDSSFLTVARFFPRVGGKLLKHCFNEWPIRLLQQPESLTLSHHPKISVILPVGGSEYTLLFQCVLAAFFGQTCKNMEVIVVEHSDSPAYETLCPEGVKYMFISQKDDRQFNKALAINIGVLKSSAPYILIHDADIVPPGTYVESVLQRLNEGWDAVRAMRFLFCLEREDTEKFMRGNGAYLPKRVPLVMQNFPGASTAVHKDTYFRIGGHDEDFLGWGGEDLEFYDRLKTVRLFPGSYSPGIHLWHTASEKKISGDRNNRLLTEKRKLPPQPRIEILHKQRTVK